MNKAIDEVRADEARRMTRDGYEPVLKKSRWCLLARRENLTSGPRQTDCILFSLALARVTFARMSEAFAVQMNGFG